ncbi:MAG: apolipoprotein N-acyltransferase [Candidatus Omnitrophota bacterium]|jgi:apolipoprotein N-acyltransferase
MLRKVILKDILLCLSSAILLALSFSRSGLWLLAWFAFLPVFFALNNKTNKQAFLLFFVTGVLFWSGTIYWLVNVTWPGTIVLVFYLALYFAVFGLVIRPFTRRSTPYALIFIPSVWVLLEYIRGLLFTGFPWAILGYSQYLNLPAIQITDITGAWGVSFLVMMVNAAIVEAVWAFKNGLRRRFKIAVISPALVLLSVLSYGYISLSGAPRVCAGGEPLRISVIQGNIPQQLKWSRGSRDIIMDTYFAISMQALKDKPDLVIWPEAALPVVLQEEPVYYERAREFIISGKTPFLLGAATLRGGNYYNSALLVPADGKPPARYDKLHLVPFGEYIPLRKALTFLETIVPIGDFSRGSEYTVFSLPSGRIGGYDKFSVLICFEDLFPGLSREFVKKGASFLVNITNDAWFGRSSSPYQHLSASVFRAVENRVFLVRSANTGVSAFISPSGRIISSVRDRNGDTIFISGYNTGEIIPSARKNGFYTRYGDIFVVICIFLAGIGIFLEKR